MFQKVEHYLFEDPADDDALEDRSSSWSCSMPSSSVSTLSESRLSSPDNKKTLWTQVDQDDPFQIQGQYKKVNIFANIGAA